MGSISRKSFLKACAALALSPVSSCESKTSSGSEAKRPNLVFVFPDEYRRQAVGFMDEDPVITPNLDRFASESLILTDAISTFPVCSPFRAMLFTGKYPQSNGVLTNCFSETEVELMQSERCFSDVLHDAGYTNGYIGKWHLDHPHEPYVGIQRPTSHWDEWTPPERRHNFEFWYAYNCRDTHMNPWYWSTDAGRQEAQVVNEWSVKHETDVAIDFIKNTGGKHRDPEKPFSLFVSYNPPHMPFRLVPRKYVDMYGGKTYRELLNRPNVDLDNPHPTAKEHVKNYFAAVTGVDEQFGRIIECLSEQGLEGNTIVVFTSDHGEMMGSHNLMYKGLPYEESVGIPFIIRWPGRISPRRDNLLLGSADIMPTLLGLMGFADRIPPAVEGGDYSNGMLDLDGPRPSFSHYIVTDMQSKGVSLAESGSRGVRTERYTYAVSLENNGAKSRVLFDNRDDPYQMENIAGQNRSLEFELTAELKNWLEKKGDPWLRHLES